MRVTSFSRHGGLRAEFMSGVVIGVVVLTQKVGMLLGGNQ